MAYKSLLRNNFNLIRMIAAMQVLVVHACNHFEYDSLWLRMLKCFPGVPLFFFISGYLIGGTYIRKHNLGIVQFFKNRVLRLYPALLLCTFLSILTVLVTGYFSTETFTPFNFIFWVLGQISFYQFYNPEFMRGFGIGVLNGSLWTIAVEIQFYLLTPLIYYLLQKSKVAIIGLFIISLAVNLYLRLYLNWDLMYMKLLSVSFLPWVYMFLLGYLTNFYSQIRVFFGKLNIWIVLVLYVLSMNLIGDYYNNAMNSINPISVLLLSILVLKFSELKLGLPNKLERIIDDYDLSYGVYIYHMPIINTLLYINLFGKTENILISIFLTLGFGLLSWITIERAMLKLKT